MDNLTHGLVGAAISKSGGDRVTPLATATLVLAANAPDIDVFSYVRGEYFALSFRRGITHGWPALLVLPFIVTAVMLAWDRWMRRRRSPELDPARAGPLLALAALGVVTHPLLDWMNTYGMRWGLPFNGAWTYGDALFIIDPWIWLTLGGAVLLTSAPDRNGGIAWAFLGMMCSLVILAFPLPMAAKALWGTGLVLIGALSLRGHRSGRTASSTVAKAGLGITVAYILSMVTADGIARGHVRDAAIAGGLEIRNIMVAPQPAKPLTAEVEVLTPDGYVPGDHHWLREPRVRLYPEDLVPLVSGPSELSDAIRDEIIEVARATPDVGLYHVWSRYPYVRVEATPEGWAVSFRDARYDGRPGAGGLSGITVLITDEDLE